MKVGVITFHNVLNYGAVLQTYALQKKMRDLGIESAVIDYNSPFFISNIVKPKIFRYKNPFHYLEDKRFYKKSCIKQAKIKRFSGKFIEKTERIDFESLTDISKQFDYIVTGSDQVWNEKVIKGDYSFFLNFVPPQKRCAYAASIGAKRFLPENLPVIRGLLKEYKAISVREETAKKALKQQMNIESVRVLDPTLLLDKNQYNELICPSKKTNQKYILLYLLNYSKTLVQSAKRLSKKLGIPVFCINPTKKRIYGVEDYSSSGICEFLELISKAEFVITNSFHGVAFSINYNKQFNVELMPSAIDVNSRITDLLDVLNVKNRIISDGKYNLKHFDYGETNQLLEIEREKSVNFIKSMV